VSDVIPAESKGNSMKLSRSALVVCLLVSVAPVGAHPLCESVWEFPELVPPEYWVELEEAMSKRVAGAEGRRQDLTLIEVEIDPLGADPNTPWRIFQNVSVRTEPSTRGGSSTVIGTLQNNSQVSAVYYIVQQTDEEWMEIVFNNQTAYFTRTRATRAHPFNVENIAAFGNLPIGTELVNRWWGVPISYAADDLAVIPFAYTTQIAGRDYRLRQDALDAFIAMRTAAVAQGINLYALSPYRSGASQTTIYLNNVNNNLAQRSSAPPGHSEHQLGTTVDIASVPGGSFIGKNSPAHVWLMNNGADYGWRQTYTATNIDETGYIEEPWHWRYFGVAVPQVDAWAIF
jgi:hypothetical protein